MRKLAIVCFAASALSMGFASPGAALSSVGFAAPQETAQSLIDDARTFCYNRYTGMFKHWGACNNHLPRVYCRSRYTGQFLHWGAC